MPTSLPEVGISVVLAGTSEKNVVKSFKLWVASLGVHFREILEYYNSPTLGVLSGRGLCEVACRLRFLVPFIDAQDVNVSDGKGTSEKMK